MHSPIPAGTAVEVRGRRWHLQSVVLRVDCRELHLAPAGVDASAATPGCLVLLEPFDRPVAVNKPARVRAVSRRAWMAAARAWATWQK